MILDPLNEKNFGIVLSVSSKFYSTVEDGNVDELECVSPSSSLPTLSLLPSGRFYVLINSVQFNTTWLYEVILPSSSSSPSSSPSSSSLPYHSSSSSKNDIIIELIPNKAQQKNNIFLQTSLELTFNYINVRYPDLLKNRINSHNNEKSNHKHLLILKLTIKGSNDFYSQTNYLTEQNKKVTYKNLCDVPPFNRLGEISKTGMGSSAALTTSLITSLLGYFGVFDIEMVENFPLSTTVEVFDKDDDGREALAINKHLKIIHNLTQLAHSISQGKIGSGFDVSSAVYGSHIYTRFNEEIINKFINCGKSKEELVRLVDDIDNTENNVNSIRDAFIWDNTKNTFILPKGFYVIMADIKGGSDTPSMSRNVMKYLKDNKDDTSVWENLRLANMEVLKAFQEISLIVSEDEIVYDLVTDYISELNSADWINCVEKIESDNKEQVLQIVTSLKKLKSAFKNMRKCMKLLGDVSSTPIEPNQQTKLADDTEADVPGIISCFVPGAGGYDAICCISLIENKTKHKIIDYWEGYNEKGDEGEVINVCPLLVEYDGGLGVELVVERGKKGEG